MPTAAASPRHLVVLHGWTLDPTVQERWQPFLILLKKLGLTIHFLPLPGLSKNPDVGYTLDDYVQWLTQETKKLPPFILMGHSFGGQLATRFTRLFPKRVSRLILIDSSGLVDQSLPKALKRSLFGSMAKVGRTVTQSPRLRKLLYRLARETDYYEANLAQRQTMRSILKDEVRTDLKAITTPTLIIWGKNDKMTPLSLGRVFESGIAGSRLVVIDGARHSPMYTHPQEVLNAIADFLKA